MNKVLSLGFATAFGLSCVSCTQVQSFFSLDQQSKEDHLVCTGAILIENAIKKDNSKLELYQKASEVIDKLLNDPEANREKLEMTLNSVLLEVWSTKLVSDVINRIMDIYDDNSAKFYTNEDLIKALEATKSSIDSGIELYENPARPVKVVPRK